MNEYRCRVHFAVSDSLIIRPWSGLFLLLFWGLLLSPFAANPATAGTVLYSPLFQTSNNFWTGIGLTNPDQANTASIDVEVYDQQGEHLSTLDQTFELPPSGQRAFVLGSGSATQGWFRISSSTMLTGLCFFGPAQNPMYMADIPLDSRLIRDLIIPHVAQDAVWDTDLYLCNPNSSKVDLEIVLYAPSGQTALTHKLTLQSQQATVVRIGELSSKFSGQVRITATLGIAAFALYHNQKDNQCGFAGIDARSGEGYYQVKTEVDIPYIDDGDKRHQLDIYSATGLKNPRTVIFVPGGAWRQGKKELYQELGRTLAGYYGITTVIINYRLSNCQDGEALHPDHINDVADAFAWVKEHIADHGGNPEKLYLFGQSAGAHLAALLLTDTSYLKARNLTPSAIQAAILMSGTYDLYDLVVYPNNPLGLEAVDILAYKKMVLDAFGGYDQDTMTKASPESYIHSQLPPLLLLDTCNDMPGFPEEATNFYDAVRAQAPAVEIVHQSLVREDYTDSTWQAAAAMAAKEPLLASDIGHWAEVATINRQEFNSRAARLTAEFILGH